MFLNFILKRQVDEFTRCRIGHHIGQFQFQIHLLIAHAYRNFPKFESFDQMVGDMDFSCSVESFAEALSGNGNDVYRYYYSHRSSRDPWPRYREVHQATRNLFSIIMTLLPISCQAWYCKAV